MTFSPDPATDPVIVDPVTLGDLCYAIEKGRVESERYGGMYELNVGSVRRWQRQEEALRVLLAPLADSLSLDLGGLA